MKYHKIVIIVIVLGLAITSCTKDLDKGPIDPNVSTAATVYDNPASYKEALAKLYAGFSTTGQQGPAGQPDVTGLDEGFSDYLRDYWNAQELPTDEAVCGWNDIGVKDFHNQNWSPSNPFTTGLYNRIYFQITQCNEYLRQTAQRIDGLSADLKAQVTMYRAEARFIRALAYWHGLDLFGSIPFVTEKDQIGLFFPKQISKDSLFVFLESELNAIDTDLATPKMNEYGRADKAAAWTLLAKLYLNAPVYLGSDHTKYTECITYCKQVIGSGYTIDPTYQNMFLADNNLSPEIIFPVTADGNHTQNYGGMDFIIHAEIVGSMDKNNFGVDGGWGGLRATKAFIQKFSDPSGNTDTRAMFYTNGQTLDINDLSSATDGYGITKFKNITSQGAVGSNPAHVDTDYPVFRLADVYLMYAEAVLRGGTGGDVTTALGYVNDLRKRAYKGTSGNVTSIDLNLILDERARELYWEGYRRTDLIRYGQFTNGTYLWPWKGGVKDGVVTDTHFNIYPIPAADRNANPNLQPTPGYSY